MPRDFQITTDVSRDALAVALCDNPEQLVYVLGEIGANADFSDVCEFHDNIAQDAAAVAQFFRGFADKIDPPTLPEPPSGSCMFPAAVHWNCKCIEPKPKPHMPKKQAS